MVSELVWQVVYKVIVGVLFIMTSKKGELSKMELTPSMVESIYSITEKVELLIQDHQEEDERFQKLEEANHQLRVETANL